MNDLGSLCVLLCVVGFIFFVVMMMLPRMFGGLPGRRGPLSPQYDDPDIESRGAFGSPTEGERPRYDAPTISSRGSFGRSPFRRSLFSRRGGPVDSGNIRSRGGFGRSKD